MFSSFSESGIQGIEIKSTGQRWYLEEPEEVAAFVRWLNAHTAQQSGKRSGCTCGAQHYPDEKRCHLCGLLIELPPPPLTPTVGQKG